jgi:hypothetical protein
MLPFIPKGPSASADDLPRLRPGYMSFTRMNPAFHTPLQTSPSFFPSPIVTSLIIYSTTRARLSAKTVIISPSWASRVKTAQCNG